MKWYCGHCLRCCVFLRNLSHFVVLFFGISFCSLFLLFGLCMMPLVRHYADLLATDVVAEHIYLLKAPLELEGMPEQRAAYAAVEQLMETDDPLRDLGFVGFARAYLRTVDLDEDARPVNTTDNGPDRIAQAEKFTAATFEVPHVITDSSEEVTVYGIVPGSRYWDEVDVSDGAVVVGSGLSQKCRIEPGDTVTLTDKYTNKSYELVVMDRYSGNLELYIEPVLMAEVVAIGAAAYVGVALIHIWRIRKVSLSEAMKVQE